MGLDLLYFWTYFGFKFRRFVVKKYALQDWAILIISIALLFHAFQHAFAEPLKVSQEGPYRVSVDGELKKKKFGAYHKALTFAINKYLKCHCEVLILAPPIQVASLVPPLSTDDVESGGEIEAGGITQTQELSGVDVVAGGQIGSGGVIQQDLDAGDIVTSVEISNGGITQTQQLSGDDIEAGGAVETGGIITGGTPIVEYSVRGYNWAVLEGAILPREPVRFMYTGEYETALWYCCKIGDEPHRPRVDGKILSLDFSTFPPDDGGQRELYWDILYSDGTLKQGNTAYFSLEPAVLHDVTLKWDAPTTREDQEALSIEQLAGYHVEYWSEGNLSDVKTAYVQPGTVLELEIDALQGGQKWFFRANAQDTTPNTECPEEQEVPYTCGGPLISQWSETVTVEF